MGMISLWGQSLKEEVAMVEEKSRTKTKAPPWAVTVSLNGKPTQFDIDTGAEVSVISQKAHRKIVSPKLYCPQRI